MTLSIKAGSSKNETFKCKICPSAYLTQSGLDKHAEKEHSSKETDNEPEITSEETPAAAIPAQPKQKVSDFKCPNCSMLYLSKAGLEKHIEKEHKELDSSNKQEKGEATKKEAIATNTRKKIPDFKCPKCPSIYLSQSGVDKHIEKEHKNEESSSKQKDVSEPLTRRKMTTFSCLQCEAKFLTRSGLDEHIKKAHEKRDEKSSKKEEGKELKMNETVIGFKASKSSRMKKEPTKAKVTKSEDIEEIEIEEIEEKTLKGAKSKGKKQTKKTSEEDDIEEMEVDEQEEKSLSKTKSRKKAGPKTSSRSTGFNCKKCDMKFITSGGLDAHNKKKHGNNITKALKPKKEETPQKSDDGSFAWPPDTGSIIATLFDDDFYLGKVMKVAANKIIKVQYMDRYKKAPKDAKDQFWVIPDKPDPPFPTARESVLGVNAMIERDDRYSTKQTTVYALTNHQTWARLGKSSRIGL